MLRYARHVTPYLGCGSALLLNCHCQDEGLLRTAGDPLNLDFVQPKAVCQETYSSLLGQCLW